MWSHTLHSVCGKNRLLLQCNLSVGGENEKKNLPGQVEVLKNDYVSYEHVVELKKMDLGHIRFSMVFLRGSWK